MNNLFIYLLRLYKVILENIDYKILFDSFKKGNKKALSKLYLFFYDYLFHYGYKLVKNEAKVENCIQDLFLNLFESRVNLGDIENVKAYLFISFRRLLLKKTYTTRIEDKMVSLVDTEIKFTEEDILMISYNEFTIEQRLHQALNDLPNKQKEVLYLKYFNKLSTKEIATVFDTSPQVILNLIYKSYKKLREDKGLKEFLANFSA